MGNKKADADSNVTEAAVSSNDLKADKEEIEMMAAAASSISKTDNDSQCSTSQHESETTNDSIDSKKGVHVIKFQNAVISCCTNHKTAIVRTILIVLFICYTIYFIAALLYSVEMATALIVITSLVVIIKIYVLIRDTFGDKIYASCWKPLEDFTLKHWDTIKWFFFPCLIIAIILYLCLDVLREAKQLQSLSGIVVFWIYTYITSIHPNRVRWRPVIWGMCLQFALAILVLRWRLGYLFVKWLADEITKFINYAYEGAAAVFGDPFLILHPFVFMGMPLLIYIGAIMSILYYCGFTQLAAEKMAWLMQKTMGTTAIETLSVSANIFLNGMDTMLMLRLYLVRLTKSEFHCLLVGGHSTVAGFAFAIFVALGAPPQHLLSAAVMSAPATIAICKLNHPETEESITKSMSDVQLSKGNDVNIFEAGANGAAVAGKTVVAVVVNYIAFLGLLAWLNATLSWIGGRVGYDELSFELICSYLFWPISLIMGVDVADCQEVAKLIGLKVCASEILAYQQLGVSISAGLLSEHSRAIATYALCGFSSISTLAIAVGVWQAVCPAKTGEMAGQMFRVLVNANVSCFLTACIAGLMYDYTLEEEQGPTTPIEELFNQILGLIPSYKDLMALFPQY